MQLEFRLTVVTQFTAGLLALASLSAGATDFHDDFDPDVPRHRLSYCASVLGLASMQETMAQIIELAPSLRERVPELGDGWAVQLADEWRVLGGRIFLHPIGAKHLGNLTQHPFVLSTNDVIALGLDYTEYQAYVNDSREIGTVDLLFHPSITFPRATAAPWDYLPGDVLNVDGRHYVYLEASRPREGELTGVRETHALLVLPAVPRVDAQVPGQVETLEDLGERQTLAGRPLAAWPEIVGHATVHLQKRLGGLASRIITAKIERLQMGEVHSRYVLTARLANFHPSATLPRLVETQRPVDHSLE